MNRLNNNKLKKKQCMHLILTFVNIAYIFMLKNECIKKTFTVKLVLN